MAEPFAYFFVSFGVACQMIIDGKVLYGQSAAAGEIGHTVVQRNGPVCPTCGNRGCLPATFALRTRSCSSGDKSLNSMVRPFVVACRWFPDISRRSALHAYRCK